MLLAMPYPCEASIMLALRRGERYFEVDVDISSSYAASGVVNIVKGATKSMVIDFGVLIEGQVCCADLLHCT
jgi:Protein ENHANCED DISEASE RESISTANCE 2, C-terminal